MRSDLVKLLIVDDDRMMRRVLGDYSWLSGWSSVSANDGGAGYLATQNQKFDVIVTDLQMPRMTGIEMVDRIRRGSGPNSDTPILVMTGINNESLRRDAYDAGATAVMVKPVLLDEFRQVVEANIASPALVKAGSSVA